MYERIHAALGRGGALVNADCCVASTEPLRLRGRRAWRAHLEREYSRARAEAFLRAWAKEDFYLTLEEELTLLRDAGFSPDVAWRRDAFAVVTAVKKPLRAQRGRSTSGERARA
jgi:hypothetical protein